MITEILCDKWQWNVAENSKFCSIFAKQFDFVEYIQYELRTGCDASPNPIFRVFSSEFIHFLLLLNVVLWFALMYRLTFLESCFHAILQTLQFIFEKCQLWSATTFRLFQCRLHGFRTHSNVTEFAVQILWINFKHFTVGSGCYDRSGVGNITRRAL